VKYDLLFERFLHTGKSAMPDVDIDISSARRDEVIAWVESRFGQATEAMVCNKITYRLPLAIQDLGRALGLPPEQRTKLSRALGRDFRHMSARRAREAGPAFDEVLGDAPVKEALLRLLERLEPAHPRHLAPHSGGVVLSREPLTHYAPLERSSGGIKIVQLDKDDAEALGSSSSTCSACACSPRSSAPARRSSGSRACGSTSPTCPTTSGCGT
jgi:error-prone DNA polymerase